MTRTITVVLSGAVGIGLGALSGPVCAIAISLLTRLLHLQIVRRRRDPSTARRQ
jgi:hypothetical protein